MTVIFLHFFNGSIRSSLILLVLKDLYVFLFQFEGYGFQL